MVFQPFVTHDLEGRSTCAYVDMFFSADTKNDPLVLKIVVADIHNFAKEFKATTEEELMKSTFAINMLSMDDKHTTAVILDKMKQIQKSFRHVLPPSTDESDEQTVQFEIQTNLLTFSHKSFKYKFILTDMSVSAQVELTRQMYSNLERYTALQTGALNSLSNQITNKNQIIKKLAYSYCEKMDPFGKMPDSVHNLYRNKCISQIFVSKRIMKYVETTATDAILQYLQRNTSNEATSTEFVDPKWECLWDGITHPNCEFSDQSKAKGKEKEDNEGEEEEKEEDGMRIHIQEFGYNASNEQNEENEFSSSSSTTRPRPKRKLQGLLRRQQKRLKTSSEEPET